MEKRFVIQDREAGNAIDSFDSLDEAHACMQEFIDEDMHESHYTPNFYEICDTLNGDLYDEELNKKN